MINKYLAGGAAPQDQQAQVQQAIAQISQATGEQPETVIAALQNGKQNFKKVLQALQQGDVQTAKQLIQQLAGKPMARLGAKLNYIRSLKGACPEGQEVKYFEKGGQVKCKCVDKAAGGEKVKDGKKEIADFKKKKACSGLKAKFEDGGKPQKPKKVEQPKKPLKIQKPIVSKDDTVHVNGKPYSITYSDGTKRNPKSPYPKYSNQQYINDRGTKDDKEAQRRVKKVDRVTKQEEMKCGGKAKKHKFGGSLNGIPFFNPALLREE